MIAVQAALEMQGIPYSWGGSGVSIQSRGIGRGANTIGFDCSGLTEYAWAKASANIGGHTSTQWQSGTRVPRNHLHPGDLLFFARQPPGPNHHPPRRHQHRRQADDPG